MLKCFRNRPNVRNRVRFDMRTGTMAGRSYGPSNSAAGKLLKQVWEARQQGGREESFRLMGEALKLAEAADPSSADYAADIRAIAQQYQGLGFVLRAEQILNAAIQRTVAAPEGQVSLKIDLLNLYAAEQRRMELLRLGDEILAGSAAVPQRYAGNADWPNPANGDSGGSFGAGSAGGDVCKAFGGIFGAEYAAVCAGGVSEPARTRG